MRRLVCLDGLRGALACYVMASHMAPFALLPSGLVSLLSHGGAAVDVFFILSGLVIVRSLDGVGWRARPFLIARFARIFPAYLPMLALAVAVQPLPNGFEAMPWIGPDSPARAIWSDGWPRQWVPELLAHLTMTHGLFPAGMVPDAWVSFLGAAWSLSTEWQFYVLVLVAGLAGLARSGGGRGVWPLVTGFMALGLIGLFWRLAASPDWQFSRAFLPNKAQYFALGIASAGLLGGAGWRGYIVALAATLALSGMAGWDKLLPPLVWTLCLVVEHGCTGVVPSRTGSACISVPGRIGRSRPSNDAGTQAHSRMPLAAGTRVLGVLRHVLSSRVMVWLGGLSYAIYLTNEPVQKLLGIVLARIADGDGCFFTLFWCPLALALPVVLAAVLHHWIELPAMRWGRILAAQISTSPRNEHPGRTHKTACASPELQRRAPPALTRPAP